MNNNSNAIEKKQAKEAEKQAEKQAKEAEKQAKKQAKEQKIIDNILFLSNQRDDKLALELARIEKERQLIAKMIASWAYRPTLQCEWHSITCWLKTKQINQKCIIK